MAGCGTPNDQATFDADAGRHSADWLPEKHKSAYAANSSSCAECHGATYDGGVSGVACNHCHLGGPGSIHPLAWGQAAALNHAPYVRSSGDAACANVLCHGPTLAGVAGGGSSCTSCHIGGTNNAHPAAWADDSSLHGTYVYLNGSSSCQNVYCHGASLGGVSGSGPACSSCHSWPVF
jgi:hypothetical protein